MRQRKHDMKVLDRKQVALSIFEPLPTQVRLALGAVAIVAGVVGRFLMTTMIAAKEMTAQLRGATSGERLEDKQVQGPEKLAVLGLERPAVAAKNIGDFIGRSW